MGEEWGIRTSSSAAARAAAVIASSSKAFWWFKSFLKQRSLPPEADNPYHVSACLMTARVEFTVISTPLTCILSSAAGATTMRPSGASTWINSPSASAMSWPGMSSSSSSWGRTSTSSSIAPGSRSTPWPSKSSFVISKPINVGCLSPSVTIVITSWKPGNSWKLELKSMTSCKRSHNSTTNHSPLLRTRVVLYLEADMPGTASVGSWCWSAWCLPIPIPSESRLQPTAPLSKSGVKVAFTARIIIGSLNIGIARIKPLMKTDLFCSSIGTRTPWGWTSDCSHASTPQPLSSNFP